MKLTKFNTASVFFIFLVVLFIVGKIFSVPVLSNYAWMSVFPVFSYLYYGQAKQRNHFFGFFLLSFSIAEILNVVFKESTFLNSTIEIEGMTEPLKCLCKVFDCHKL